jgi:hypothetical protein
LIKRDNPLVGVPERTKQSHSITHTLTHSLRIILHINVHVNLTQVVTKILSSFSFSLQLAIHGGIILIIIFVFILLKSVYVSVNIAVGKPAFQSSIAFDGVPSRAVDGNRNPDYFSGSCCHTTGGPEGETNPWWAVDLQQSRLVDRVDLTNRVRYGRMYILFYLIL